MMIHAKVNHPENILIYQNIVLNKNAYSLLVNDERVDLSKLEFETLSYLLEHKNIAIHRRELLEQIWKMPKSIETRATDDTMKRLRQKLKEAKAHIKIETIRGFGFIIRNPPKINT